MWRDWNPQGQEWQSIWILPQKEGDIKMNESNEAMPVVEDLVEAGDSCSGGCGGSSAGCACDSSGAMPTPSK